MSLDKPNHPMGDAYVTHDRRLGRVGILVQDDGSEAEASITPRQARHLAIKLLAAAERAERKVKSVHRQAVLTDKARTMAKGLLLGGEGG